MQRSIGRCDQSCHVRGLVLHTNELQQMCHVERTRLVEYRPFQNLNRKRTLLLVNKDFLSDKPKKTIR